MTEEHLRARITDLERRLYGRGDAEDAPAPEHLQNLAAELGDARTQLARLRSASTPDDAHAGRDRGSGSTDTRQAAVDAARLSATGDGAPPRARRGLTGMAVAGLVAITAGALLAPPSPAALDRLDSDIRPLDLVRTVDLQASGLPLLATARVIAESDTARLVAFRTPEGTGALLDEGAIASGGEVGSDYPGVTFDLPPAEESSTAVPAGADVCAWIMRRDFLIDGRCVTLDDFARSGIVFEAGQGGFRYSASWAPDGTASISLIS